MLQGFGSAGGQTTSVCESNAPDGLPEQGMRFSNLRTPFLDCVLSAHKRYGASKKYTGPCSDKGQGHISGFFIASFEGKSKTRAHK